MAKYCVYCGNPLKNEDKFCIICGKPVLAGVKKSEKTEVEKVKEFIRDKKTPKEEIVEESFGDNESLSKKPENLPTLSGELANIATKIGEIFRRV